MFCGMPPCLCCKQMWCHPTYYDVTTSNARSPHWYCDITTSIVTSQVWIEQYQTVCIEMGHTCCHYCQVLYFHYITDQYLFDLIQIGLNIKYERKFGEKKKKKNYQNSLKQDLEMDETTGFKGVTLQNIYSFLIAKQ